MFFEWAWAGTISCFSPGQFLQRPHFKTSTSLIPILTVGMFGNSSRLDIRFFFICQNNRKHFSNLINVLKLVTSVLLDFLQIRLCDRQREGQTEIESSQEREGADERETDWEKTRKGGWERWRGQSKEIRRELNEKCTEKNRYFTYGPVTAQREGEKERTKWKK